MPTRGTPIALSAELTSVDSEPLSNFFSVEFGFARNELRLDEFPDVSVSFNSTLRATVFDLLSVVDFFLFDSVGVGEIASDGRFIDAFKPTSSFMYNTRSNSATENSDINNNQI